MEPVSPKHPLYGVFSDLVGAALARRRAPDESQVQLYLTDLLVRFLHSDAVFAVRREGRPLQSVIEMTAEADVRLNADSFERERQVHRHIGDYILFWGALYPDFLRRLKTADGLDLVCDYADQGRRSYFIVSTFDYPPYSAEAPTFRTLSEGFQDYSLALADVGESLPRSA